MFSQLGSIHWLAVLVAFLAYFILGVLWFTLFFPKPYKASLGRAEEALPSKPIFIIGPALCALVITIATEVLMSAFHIHSLGDAFQLAFVVGIGYLGANTVNIAINPNMPHPIRYGIISAGYHLAGIILVCLILAIMT